MRLGQQPEEKTQTGYQTYCPRVETLFARQEVTRDDHADDDICPSCTPKIEKWDQEIDDIRL
jgi:hypothetical protein